MAEMSSIWDQSIAAPGGELPHLEGGAILGFS
jgi:hypothetical protein